MAYSTNIPLRGTVPTLKSLTDAGMGAAEAQELINETQGREYGGGMSKAELQDFDTLIGRLEASKLRQGAQGGRQRQRQTIAGGLANMMGNF